MKFLRQRFTGPVALDYEKDRRNRSGWLFEEKALREMFDLYPDIGSVWDFPCGTGRFFDLYQDFGIHSFGLDINPDMFNQALHKGMVVAQADIFIMGSRTPRDAAICFGFLNWCDLRFMAKAVATLRSITSKYLILSIQTRETFTISRSRNRYYPSIKDLDSMVSEVGLVRIKTITDSSDKEAELNIINYKIRGC